MIGEKEGISILVYLIVHVKNELRGKEGFLGGNEIVNLLGQGLVEHHGNRRMEKKFNKYKEKV